MVNLRMIFLINGVRKTLLPDYKAVSLEMAEDIGNLYLCLFPDCVAVEISLC
jgi:hypothetical protein